MVNNFTVLCDRTEQLRACPYRTFQNEGFDTVWYGPVTVVEFKLLLSFVITKLPSIVLNYEERSIKCSNQFRFIGDEWNEHKKEI